MAPWPRTRPTWGWNPSSTAVRSSASDATGSAHRRSGGVLVDLLARVAGVVPVAEPTLVLAVGRRRVPGRPAGADAGRERLDGCVVAGAVEERDRVAVAVREVA